MSIIRNLNGVRRRHQKRLEKKLNEESSEPACLLCDLNKNEPYLGQLFSKSNLHIHENCLYFSPVLNQELDPSTRKKDYILGFNKVDIDKEIKRISRLKCCVCKKRKAGIGCCISTCKKSFHLYCGLQHGAVGIFTDTFKFSCKEHAKRQDLQNQITLCDKIVPECTICLDFALGDNLDVMDNKDDSDVRWLHFLDEIKKFRVIHGMCCNRSWMHRSCISGYGLSAGLHHVKCPNCGNTSSFVDTVQNCGIWLPDRDASWELEPGAFQDMYEPGPIEITVDPVENDENVNSSANQSVPHSPVFSDINDENLKPDNETKQVISSNNSSETIQTDIRRFLITPPSSTSSKILPKKRKRVSKNEQPIVPLKRRRKSKDKVLQSASLIQRQCSKCTKSLVCFNFQCKSNTNPNQFDEV